MRNKISKILFIILIAGGLLFLNAPKAEAGPCEWKAYYYVVDLMSGISSGGSGGCTKDESDQCKGSCPESEKPKDTVKSGTRITYVCCSNEEKEVVLPDPPKFNIPQLQISIPNLKFNKVECIPNDMSSATSTYECSIPWLSQYISAIYDYGVGIAGILAAIVLMAGGILWLVSGGDAGKVTQARELIVGSVIGLIILMSSYIILEQINPDLVKLKSIKIGAIGAREITQLAKAKNSQTAKKYVDAGCPTNQELEDGIEFYATGYCKPAWEDTDAFRCLIAMNCSCPNGRDTSKNCDKWFGKTYPGYAPCKSFDKNTPYCNKTSSGIPPFIGSVAGPHCEGLPYNTKVCFNHITYTITDSGGGIKGRRIDIWTGDDCDAARKVTQTGTFRMGGCGSW